MSEATPRINAQYLEQFTHQTVRILGKVTDLSGEQATLDAQGRITLHLNRVRPPTSIVTCPPIVKCSASLLAFSTMWAQNLTLTSPFLFRGLRMLSHHTIHLYHLASVSSYTVS